MYAFARVARSSFRAWEEFYLRVHPGGALRLARRTRDPPPGSLRCRASIAGHQRSDPRQNFRASASLNEDRQRRAPVPPEYRMWRSGLVDPDKSFGGRDALRLEFAHLVTFAPSPPHAMFSMFSAAEIDAPQKIALQGISGSTAMRRSATA